MERTFEVVIHFGGLRMKRLIASSKRETFGRIDHELLADLRILEQSPRVSSDEMQTRITIHYPGLEKQVESKALALIKACFNQHDYRLLPVHD